MVTSKSKSSESRIVAILKEAKVGAPVTEPPWGHGVSRATSFKWRGEYAGPSVADRRQLRELKAENASLKRTHVDLALENAAMKDLLAPKL